MKQWPHAPVHLVDEAAAFMVTSGTYHKKRFFDSPEKLRIVHDSLLQFASDFGWNLQAWAVMSNHYHFVAFSPDNAGNLTLLISKLHMLTAKQINLMDDAAGRKVWFQYWDSRITYEKSYLARLNYVHNNPVHHGIVDDAVKYPWCSAAWFEREAEESFLKTVSGFKTDRLSIRDDFD
jgi:putative transposase